MKNKMTILIAGLLVALLAIGVIGATNTLAQGSNNPVQYGYGHGGHGFGLGQAELEAVAKALGMTTDELSTALQSGKTLEQLATEKGVDIQKVQDAINTAHREELRTRINQAVSDGTITQAKADWLLEGLDKGFLDGPGFGFGPGFGPHGHGPDTYFGQGTVITPTPQTNP